MIHLGFTLLGLLPILVQGTGHLHLESPDRVSTAANDNGTMHTAELLAHTLACPEGCNCTSNNKTLSVYDCKHDPAQRLNEFLQDHLDIPRLSITNSYLRALPTAVCNMTSLQWLRLSGNRLSDLPWRCLHKLEALEVLSAKGNRLKTLRNYTFYGFRRLKQVDLSHNMITEIEEDVFSDVTRLPALKVISLKHNNLKSLDPWILGFLNRSISVTLHRNQISNFTNRLGHHSTCTEGSRKGWIGLHNNKIRYISDILHGWGIDIPCLFGTSFNVDVRNNPFDCNCKDLNIFKVLQMSSSPFVTELNCATPESLRRQRIMSIPLDRFVCRVSDNCPAGCHCINTPYTFNLTISCAHAQQSELPAQLPHLPGIHYSYHLFFDHNNLTDLSYRDYLQKTETGVFNNNEIDKISLRTLEGLKRVRTLQLHGNNLARLPNDISAVPLTSAKFMTFHDNPWVCDCHSIEMKHWFIKHKKVIAMPAGTICVSPLPVKGYSLIRLGDDRLICDKDVIGIKTILAACLLTAGTVFSLFTIGILIVGAKRVAVYRIFGFHPFDVDECSKEVMTFDCFALYDSNDDEFALHTMIPALQRKSYRVCFPQVHFVAGMPIVDNIWRCIESSRRTVVYFTESFIRNDIYLEGLFLAFSDIPKKKQKRLIVILDDCLNMSTIDPKVCAFLSRCNLIKRNSEDLWDKLFYALPLYPMMSAEENASPESCNTHARGVADGQPELTRNANGSNRNNFQSDIQPLIS